MIARVIKDCVTVFDTIEKGEDSEHVFSVSGQYSGQFYKFDSSL